jgi:hypothetical protein
MKEKLKRLWAIFWGERIRDWDWSEQFSAFFWRDSQDARPGCLIAGIIAAIVILIVAAMMGTLGR